MTKSSSLFTTEHLLYAAAVGLALVVRLWGLGRAPLGENEAHLALQALNVAVRQPADFGAAPLLTALIGLAFFLLGSTDAVARLVPALLGSLLPLLAWPLRRDLGRKAALVLAFALALDPGLVALSRVADSPVPAVLALAGAVLAAARARWDWALPLAVLGLLLGTVFWLGLLAVLLALVLWRIGGNAFSLAAPPEKVRRGLINAVLVAAFIATTAAVWASGMFGAALGSLTAFLQGMVTPSGVPAAALWAALFVYAPLAVGGALVGGVLAFLQKQVLAAFLALLALSALLFVFLFPAHQTADLAVALLPLWALAAWALARLPAFHKDMLWQGTIVLVLLTFAWLSLASWEHTLPHTRPYTLSLLLTLISLLLVPLLSATMALSSVDAGRTWAEALGGLSWGLAITGAVFTLAAGQRAAFAPRTAELWYATPAPAQVRLLQASVADLGEWRHGRSDAMDLVNLTPSEALMWAFHNLPQARARQMLSSEATPEAIVAPETWQPAQTSAYRGEAFPLRRAPAWMWENPQAFVRWLAFRPTPPVTAHVILWARTDVFPQHTNQP